MENKNIVFGTHPVLRALKEPEKVEKVFMLQSAKGPLEMEVRGLCQKHFIPFIKTKEEKLNYLTRKQNHQGIVAIIAPIRFQAIENIVPQIFEKGEQPFFIILDRVTDVRNFGAIARSAEILGCHGIIIPKKGSASINDEAIKTSAGAIFDIPICRVHNLLVAIDYLKSAGIKVLLTDINADHQIAQVDLDIPLAVVLGSEDLGIFRELYALADNTISIPQVGKTQSLNVSVAAGVIMYEILRQRTLS